MIRYFGYGSNLNFRSLAAKGVSPTRSVVGRLPAYRLAFNVEHWFRHEGGMGNIVPSDDPTDFVEGVVHDCTDADLAALDRMEAYGVGYDRIEVMVDTAHGPLPALAYVGMPGIINDSCLPTRRYLNIILQGARAANLSPGYLRLLEAQPLFTPPDRGPFDMPADIPVFDAVALSSRPTLTALAGAVFDMEGSRPQLSYLHGFFGGKDMTMFHLRRLDTSDGKETIDDFLGNRLSAYQRQYLNNYLHEYAREFTLVGRYAYRPVSASNSPGR